MPIARTGTRPDQYLSRLASTRPHRQAIQNRSPAGLVFNANHNAVNEYSLKWGFEEACKRAEIAYCETKAGGIIWHDLRRTFATRRRANGVHEYDIQDLLGHAKLGVTKVYARATLTVLEGRSRQTHKAVGRSDRLVSYQHVAPPS